MGWVPFYNVCVRGTLQGLATQEVLTCSARGRCGRRGSLQLAPTLSLRLIPDVRLQWMFSSFCAEDL